MIFEIKKIRNGLNFISCPRHNSRSVAILAIVGAGSISESRENNGVSHFLEHILLKGTERWPTSSALSTEIDNIGGELEAFTSREYTGFLIKAEVGSADTALEILSDILLRPKISSRDIETERGVILEELSMYEDNPIVGSEELFENQFVGLPLLGSEKNIKTFKRRDLLNYYNEKYVSSNTVICLAGGVNKRVLRKAIELFSGSRNYNKKPEQLACVNRPIPKIKVYNKKTDKIHFSLGFRTYPVRHVDEYMLRFISILLGGCFSSRNIANLKEKKGIVYDIKTDAEFFFNSGYLSTQAVVSKSHLKLSIKEIMGEYKKLKTHLVNNEELDKIKKIIYNRNILQIETNEVLATWLGRQAISVLLQNGYLDKKLIFDPNAFTGKFMDISAMDILRVANEVFTRNNLSLTIYGSYKKDSKLDSLLENL